MTIRDPTWNMNTGASSHLKSHSMRQFTRDNKCSVVFDEFGFSVKDFLTRHILLRCDSSGDLYPVTKPSPVPSALLSISPTTWHQRLGYPGAEVLRSLISRNYISCNKEKSSHICHACHLGKHVKLMFVSSDTRVSSSFDIIHSDIWTSPIVSVGGFKYYVLFLDHFSHYLWIYSLRHKSDVFQKFLHFRSYVKNQFKCEIKAFQCDHGGEFDNTNLLHLFEKIGIQFCFSCPRTSQQNGKSERMVRTINNVICTLLFQAHIPPTFWVEALHMAAYLLNLLPSTAINNDIPCTKLFQKEPDYSRLRTFGCLCYPHLDSPHKLAPRATPCIFLGYPSYHRGYRCLDLSTNKIILSRHVTFDENQFPMNFLTHLLLPSHISPLFKSRSIALSDPSWRAAMHDKYNALVKNSTWMLVSKPPNANVVWSMWLFRHKYHADGSLSRYKAQLVVNGRTQQVGIDCDDTFSPVVKPPSIRTVLSLALSRGWRVHQLDVKNAFLNGDLSEMVYMYQPPGFVDSRFPHHVFQLQRFLYGLKQAPRAWFQMFASYALRVGFSSSRCDSSLFIYQHGSEVAYLLIYVDGIVLTASSTDLLRRIISSLHKEFDMTNLGALNYFLGISVIRDSIGMFLSQKKYALELLKMAHMANCGLQYLIFTRPDISYAVQQVFLHMHDPREPHLAALKRVLRYVRGTLDFGLQLYASITGSLVAYTNVDWAGCPTTRRSTSGYCVFLGDNLLSWSAKRQHTLSRSSAEAEYRGVANVVAETVWLHNLLRELHTPLLSATLVYCDNVSAIYMTTNLVQHQRTKHIEIDIHFVRDMFARGQVRVLHVPSRYQYADIFTKGPPFALFEEFRTSLSVRPFPAQTAGAY
ncbi:ribonuclease H-like domain-containing protein [Tanacetum coccineum]